MNAILETITLALIPGFLLLDFVVQRRRFDKTGQWRLRASLVTTAIFFCVSSSITLVTSVLSLIESFWSSNNFSSRAFWSRALVV